MRPFSPRRGEISVVLNFTKMEGCGNDYIYVDCLTGLSFDPAAAAVALSPRHFAVGADGLICICHSDVADAKMRMFNADGSEGSMCGNGVRCVAQWLFEHGLVKDEARVETRAGIKTLQRCGEGMWQVEMGKASFAPADLPALGFGDGPAIGKELMVGGRAWPVTCVSVGNPHCVTLGPDDYTTPSLDSPVTEGMGRVRVHRVTYTENTARETVPYETEYLDETAESTGKYSHEVLVQAGQDGLVDVTYRQKYVDGGYSGTEVVDTQVVTEMIPEIYRKYNSDAVSPLQAPEGITVENNVPSSYSKMYSMKATGYYSARGRGASGLGLYYGTFACDPTLIPYGTKVYITSADGKFVYGWAIATDTGAFVQSNRMQVDLFYETYAESVANGVKYVNVYVP